MSILLTKPTTMEVRTTPGASLNFADCYLKQFKEDTNDSSVSFPEAPCGLWVVRIDPLRFLAGCHKRRLNQALSVLSLSLGFF